MSNATNGASRRTAAQQVLTFPATRRLLERLLGPPESRRTLAVAAGWLALTLFALPPYVFLRGQADNVGLPVHGAGLTGFEVVFSGEHYMLDVMGVAAFALAMAQLSRVPFLACGKRVVAWVKASWTFVPRLRPSGSESGQALIEFAFVLPIMLVFLLVLFDFGLALDHREVIQHAVREGARYGAVQTVSGGDTTVIKTDTVNESKDVLDATNVSVCYADGPDGETAGNVGSYVQVSVNYTYNFSIGSGELLSALGIGVPHVDMNPKAQARLETPATGITGSLVCPPP